METTIKTHSVKQLAKTSTKTKVQAASTFWDKMEMMRFGLTPMILTVIGCMGGIAAAFGAQADALKLAVVAFPAVIALALTLAVYPMKAILWAGGIAILLDLIVLIF